MVNTLGNSTEAPKTVGAIPGLKAKIMTALAALGIMASPEKVDGAVVAIVGLPTSGNNATTLQPSHVSGFALSSTVTPSSSFNARLYDTNARLNDTSIERIGINVSAADLGLLGGTFTITGTLVSTTDNAALDNGVSVNGGGAGFRLIQEARFGFAGGPMTTLDTLDSGTLFNQGSNTLTDTESWSGAETFTRVLNITQPGTYHLENHFTRTNVSGMADLQGFNISYAANIPEPSVSVLSAGALGALLLRRRREENKES